MKTTVDLPDALAIAAKKRAAELQEPLRVLIERGLRAELQRSRPDRERRPRHVKLKWLTVDGGLPTGLDVADRAAMHEWLRSRR
jgi:hypothetical protein